MRHSTTAAFAGAGALRRDAADASRARTMPLPAVDLAVIDTLEAMRALADDWRALETDAAAHNFWQSFDWSMRWAERFLTTPHCLGLAILTGRQDGRLVMLWPLMIAREGPFRALKWLSDPFPQYGDALVAREADREGLLRAAWLHLAALPDIDTIVLRKVRADAAANGVLAASCAHTTEKRVGCFMEIGRFASHDELMKALPSRRRQLRRKLRKKLEEAGPLAFETAFSGDRFVPTIRETMRLKRQWLKDTGQVSKPVSDPRLDDLLASFADAPEGGPRVAVGTLTCGGRPAAYEVAFHYKRHHYLYIIAQTPEFVEQSPSKVQVDEAQAWGLQNGIETFDLLPPSDRYKRDLSDQTIEVFDYVKAASASGRLHVFYLTRLRPLLKTLYLRYAMALAAWLRGRATPAAPGE